LVATYERSLISATQNGTSFPAIPDQNTFVNLGLNARPTFFGCNASNTTTATPLVVYVPNAPYIFQSNVSTFNLSYTLGQRNLLIRNGYDSATRANGTLDNNWLVCLSCAVLSRSFTKTGTAVPTACQDCFSKYCWNGTLAPQTPETYNPNYQVEDLSYLGVKSEAAQVAASLLSTVILAALIGFSA
jgi:lysophospholipase